MDRLRKGEKFANIAKKVSLCPSGKRGISLKIYLVENTKLWLINLETLQLLIELRVMLKLN